MATQRPTDFIEWVPDGASTNIAKPPQAISTVGFQPNQPLPAAWLNGMFRTLDQWCQFLAESSNSTVLATSLIHNIRLIGGGTWQYASVTGVLSWSAPWSLACPSTPDGNNRAAAGQVTLKSGQVAYVQANLPFSTSADLTADSVTLTNIGYEAGIATGQSVLGAGIPEGTVVVSVAQDSCVLSKAPTASATQQTLTFVGTGALVVSVADETSLIPGPMTVVVARSTGATCAVGVNGTELWLRDGEARSLVTQGYLTTVQAPAGVALSAGQAVYLSTGTADGRTAGSLYPCDASAANGALRAAFAGLVHTAADAGATAHVVRAGLVTMLTGLVPGATYYLDPTTPGALTTTRPTATGQYLAPVGLAVASTMLLVHASAPTPLNMLSGLALRPPAAGTVVQGYAADGTAAWSVSDKGDISAATLTTSGRATLRNLTLTTGIRTIVNMGSYWATGSNQTEVSLKTILNNEANNGLGSMTREWMPQTSGSIMGYSARVYATNNTPLTLNVRASGSVLATFSITPTAGTYVTLAGNYPKGTYAFNGYQPLTVSIAGLSSTALNQNLQCSVDLTVELFS